MFEHITVTITEAEVKQLIKEKVAAAYPMQVIKSVDLHLKTECTGFGPMEHVETKFDCFRVELMPKDMP